MKTSIHIYGYESCPYYHEAIELAKKAYGENIKYRSVTPGKKWDTIIKKAHQKYKSKLSHIHMTSPLIIMNHKIIGGLNELENLQT